jgi:NAD(P)-dependent dehydrogenase (short-subunit alcohol dehydrogenase family)
MGALTNKVAVVTGASKGIGAGIAVAFGAAGAAVVVNYASDAQGAGRAVARIKSSVGQPDDIAKVAIFLASSDSGWLTGEIMLASDGQR